jgi:hypothetical protein
MAEITHFNRYNNSKIYKICSNLSDKIYIGSTTQSIQQRLSDHVSNYNTRLTNNRYVSSFEIIKLGDAFIVLLEQCNFNNKQQLDRREGEFIKQNINITINMVVPGRTKKEYEIENAEQIKERHRQYRIDNKQKKKDYNNVNKEKIANQNKQYYNDNKEKIKQYQKEQYNKYYNVNKEKINEQKKQKYNDNKHTFFCECGLSIVKSYLNKHKQTKKHLDLIIIINELTFYNL